MKAREYGDRYAEIQLKRRDSSWRPALKQRYLDRVLRHVSGPTVDIGCGAGQLLAQLPAGSVGLEVNPALVEDLRSKGLPVFAVAPPADRISLRSLESGRFQTAVLSHVLEHFDDAATVLQHVIADCAAVGIVRLIVVVPGDIGYRSDPTHRTFVTLAYLRDRDLLHGPGFRIVHRSYFPGNLALIGRLFIYHELMVVYDIDANERR